jgi:hypothetical protein
MPLGRAQDKFEVPFEPDSVRLQPAEASEILGSLCPGESIVGSRIGCRICPAGTSWAGDGAGLWVRSAIRGHLLGPNSDDLLISTSGCEPHVYLFGGHVLFSRRHGRWAISGKYAPVPMGSCLKIRNTGGVDGLVCFRQDSHYDSDWAGVSFEYVEADRKMKLASARDNLKSCWSAQKSAVYIEAEIVSVQFRRGQGSTGTLVIAERCRRGSLRAQAQRACVRQQSLAGMDPLTAPFYSYRLQYTFDGAWFTLAPTSVVRLRELDMCLAADQK